MPASVLVDLHPCARCAQMQKTCCQRADVFVTLGDLDRIGAHTGHGEFVEMRAPEDPDYLDLDEDDPLWHQATVRADGTRRVLQRRAGGDCTFLGEAGCVLAEDVRPLICRLYPYEFNEAGFLGESADYCPPSFLTRTHTSMAQVLDIGREQAEAWRVNLYAELRLEVAAR